MIRTNKGLLSVSAILLIILLALNAAGCGRDPGKQNGSLYELKHSTEDIDYILPWNEIAARDPDIEDPEVYDRSEIFAPKGDPGSPVGLDESQPAAWFCMRRVMKRQAAADARGIAIYMWFFETRKGLEKHLKAADLDGMDITEENGFTVGMTKDPKNVCELIIAGNQICIVVSSAAPSIDAHLFDIDELSDLEQVIKEKVEAIKVTEIPW